MLSQSKEVQDAWRAPQRTLDIKIVVNGKSYTATDINSLKYDSGAYTGDTFAIGSTYSNTVQIEFSHLVEGLKLGMEVHPSIGIKTSSGYVYEQLGVFIISSEIKMDRNNNLTTISASDRFCGLEGAYKSKLTYPAKVLDVIAEICAQSGVKANTDDLSRLPHQEDLPTPITGQSSRKALGWIAQLYAGYATFDRQGLFTIRTIAEPNYELDPSQYEQAGLTKNEAPYKINGIQCQVTTSVKTRDGEDTEETKTLQIGDANGTQIKLENNIMTPERLNAIWEQIKDITFYPFSLNWFGNPAVEAGDWLRLKDKKGNSFVVPNNSYTLDFNGGLSATSKADQTTSSDQMTPWQGSIAQAIKELQVRRAPDGTVVFPPSVTEPPQNAKFNDVWFKKNGNATELWVFEKQSDGSGKWVRKDLSDGEIRKIVDQAQSGLIEAKQQIEANKKLADQSLSKLDDSVAKLQSQYDNNIVPDLTKVSNDVSDALQKYISAQNNIADLTKQAQAQVKDIADITKTVDGLNINYANLLGDVNATKIDVKGLQTTLGTANGDINQLKIDAQHMQGLLAGKVDNSTYTNFVNLTNQALQGKLTASDLNGYAKTVDLQATANGLRIDMNSVTDRLNNLKIGGRNLISNSDKDIVIESKTTNPWPAWCNKVIYWDLTPGETYTFSVSATNTNNVQEASMRIWNSTSNKEVGSANFYFLADGKRHSKTFTVPKDGTSYSVWLYAGHMGKIEGKSFTTTFHHPMLQIGNAGTEWVPSTDDIQHDLTELSGRINATNQQFSSYYTKSETDNQTNSAKNAAVNTIKNDGNWKGLSNILTNSGFLQSADGFLQKVQQTTQPMINRIQVGNRNLLKGTRDFDSRYWYNSDQNHSALMDNPVDGSVKQIHSWADWASYRNNQIIELDPNKDYMISADVAVYGNDGNGLYVTAYGTLDNQPIALTQDLNLIGFPKQVNNEGFKRIYLPLLHHGRKLETFRIEGHGNWNAGLGSVYISKIALYEGNTSVNWNPAPEDMATQSAFSELSQSLEGLRSTVSSNYGTLQSLNSQTATAIRNEVTDKVNNLQGQITTQANNINLAIGSVGDLSNICRNPDFMDGKSDGWEGVGSSSGNGSSPSKYYGGINHRDGYYGNWFSVATGDKYYFSVYAWQDVSSNNFNLGLVYEQKDGTWTWQSAVSFNPNENLKTKYGTITIPNNAVKARVWVQIDATANFGNWWFTNVVVKKNDTLAQINMSAGTTLIQNDKIYMDASSTIFSGNAFIPSAAITSLNADKITTGTLNAANVNIINLNANNITTGTLSGSNGQFILDSGSLHVWQSNHDAWIDKNGIHDYDNSGNNVWISNGAINAYGNSSGAYLYDGGLYLHKSQSLSDAVLNPNYGSITKSDNVVAFGTSGLDVEGKDGFLLRTHGWNDQTLSYISANPIIGSGISGKSDGFMNIAAKKQIFLYAGEPVQGNGIKSLSHLVLDGTNQNGQTSLNGTFSQYMLQGPSSGFNGGLILQDDFVNVGSLNSKNSLSISSNGASLSVNGKSLLSLGGIFPGVQGDFNVSGNFTVNGSKNAIVPTSRGMAAINAYETTEYYFGDIGESATNSNGEITVMIDPFFLETVNTIVPYQVFLTAYSNANVWIASRSANCFVVKSSKPNIHFAWEIKAKRKGYENDRMKIVKGV